MGGLDGSRDRPPPADKARSWLRGLGSRRVRFTLLVVLVVGGGVRVAWVALEAAAPPFASDPSAYLLQGVTIARGEGYTNALVDVQNEIRRQRHETPLAAEPTAFYPPGYPTFVAAVTWTVWHTPLPDRELVRTIEYLQAALGTLTILLVFLLARRVFDARVALLAAAIVAVYPNLIAMTATLQFETVFITLLLVTMLVLLPAAVGDDQGRLRLIVSGGLIGAVALVHPTIGLLIFAFLAARLTLRRPWRETVRDVLDPRGMHRAGDLAVDDPQRGPTARLRSDLHRRRAGVVHARNSEATGNLDLDILRRQCDPKHKSSSLPKQEVAAIATRPVTRSIGCSGTPPQSCRCGGAAPISHTAPTPAGSTLRISRGAHGET